MDVERVIGRVERDFEPAHIDRLLGYIRQPSVSALGWGVEEMAGLLAEEIRALGGEAEAVRAHVFRPEFTVLGLKAGFVGEGKSVKVSLPAEARAAVNMRFQPGEVPEESIARVRRILAEGGFGDVELAVNNAYAGGGTPPDHPLVRCFVGVHRAMGAEPEVWPVHPPGMPVALWTEALGRPWVAGLPCNAMRKHGANGYAQVAGILQSERFLARFLQAFSGLKF